MIECTIVDRFTEQETCTVTVRQQLRGNGATGIYMSVAGYGILTPAGARELGRALLFAADQAEHAARPYAGTMRDNGHGISLPELREGGARVGQ